MSAQPPPRGGGQELARMLHFSRKNSKAAPKLTTAWYLMFGAFLTTINEERWPTRKRLTHYLAENWESQNPNFSAFCTHFWWKSPPPTIFGANITPMGRLCPKLVPKVIFHLFVGLVPLFHNHKQTFPKTSNPIVQGGWR